LLGSKLVSAFYFVGSNSLVRKEVAGSPFSIKLIAADLAINLK